MDHQQRTHSESNDMSEINISRFIEAARQYLFGLFPVDDATGRIGKLRPGDTGYAAGCYSLGSLYDEGRGVPRDYAEAVKWYHAAAEQGEPQAQFNLGVVDYHQKKFTDSYSRFSTYLSNYPEGKYRDNVQFMSSQVESILGISTTKPPGRRTTHHRPMKSMNQRLRLHPP